MSSAGDARVDLPQHVRAHGVPARPGWSFIVSGNEKVVVAQEKLHHNTPYVFPVRQPSAALQCEIRSCHERKLRYVEPLRLHYQLEEGAIPEMVVTLPFLTMYVPALALFRLLGVADRADAMRVIVGDEEAQESPLLKSILDNDRTADMDVATLYEYVGKEGTREATRERRQRYIDHIINCEVLPHQGLTRTPEVLRSKALYLGLMVRKLMRVYTGDLQSDDRDHFATKRVDCAGTQFGLLARQIFRVVHSHSAWPCTARRPTGCSTQTSGTSWPGSESRKRFVHSPVATGGSCRRGARRRRTAWRSSCRA